MSFFKKSIKLITHAQSDELKCNERDPAQRVLIVLRGNGVDRFSGVTAKAIGCFAEKPWNVESVSPVFFASIESDFFSESFFLDLCECLERNHPEMKFIITKAIVDFGLIGAGVRFSYGSTGPSVTALVNASVLLSDDHNWIDEKLCYKSIDRHESRRVGVDGVYYVSR